MRTGTASDHDVEEALGVVGILDGIGLPRVLLSASQALAGSIGQFNGSVIHRQ